MNFLESEKDHLLCKVCRGNKIVSNPTTKKTELCPLCEGTGTVANKALETESKNSNRTILYG